MKNKQLTIPVITTMTSLEIAELVQSRHDKVKQSIERLSDRNVISLPPMGEASIVDTLGRKQRTTVYNLCKRDSLIVVAQLCPEFTALLVDRWEFLEQENLHLRNELLLKEKARQDARLEYRPMTDAVKAIRGDSVKAYHYSNEANLVYLVVMGATCKKLKEHLEIDTLDNLRDELTPLQIQAVQDIQKHNTTLIEIGMSYEERKDKLNVLFNRKWADKLLEEHIKLEA